MISGVCCPWKGVTMSVHVNLRDANEHVISWLAAPSGIFHFCRASGNIKSE